MKIFTIFDATFFKSDKSGKSGKNEILNTNN